MSLLPIIATATVNITWEPPKTRTDGTPLEVSELKEYTIFADVNLMQAQEYTVPPSVITYTIPDLTGGCFTMTATDLEGRESSFSEVKCKDSAPPPAQIPASAWKVLFASSFEEENWLMRPEYAFNRGDPTQHELWHSRYSPTEALPPHELAVDMGNSYALTGFSQQTRAGGGNATAKDFEFYLSNDGVGWTQVATGSYPPGEGTYTVYFTPENVNTNSNVVYTNGEYIARYWKFVCLSEQDGGNQCSTDEIYLIGKELILISPPTNIIME